MADRMLVGIFTTNGKWVDGCVCDSDGAVGGPIHNSMAEQTGYRENNK